MDEVGMPPLILGNTLPAESDWTRPSWMSTMPHSLPSNPHCRVVAVAVMFVMVAVVAAIVQVVAPPQASVLCSHDQPVFDDRS